MLRFLIWLTIKFINASYKFFNFCWKRLVWFDSVVEGFWLSVLSEDELNKSIISFYKRNKQYTQDEQTTKGLFNWEKNIANNIPIKNARIVVLGAGGGRECLALNRLGYKLSGYESDKKMVEYAQKYFANLEIDIAFNHIPINTIPHSKCDIFWFGWGMYTHIFSQERRVQMLCDVKKQIPQNGYIIISYWKENREFTRRKIIENMTKKINRRPVEAGEGFRNGFWTKRFTPDQIKEEAALVQLKVVHISEVEYGHAILAPQ
ncbi:class I SAM-dependent methyltransferase [Labilibacter marinus]|uniref:class I SAM-dependent methyltransferase n=1 Tax=Labilibacter marinus TaxID=1477105 RepID=UPI00094F5BEF|nr:class I SAM-dependent methyltransferase [Labilibacter marinus]